ncbi:MAG: glycosyltransferase family 2 protein [Cyanophyceae cyanobacterium]
MKISVIIPCYNAAETIATQLEALANQHWCEPWEIIISDNGSTDETLLIVEQYQQRLPNLRVIDSSSRRGGGYARNRGVLAARGDAIAFCDDDDEVAPGWIAAMGEALSQYDFVAGRLEFKKLNQPWVIQSHACPQQHGLQKYREPPFLEHAAGCNLGVKRSIHEAVGGFDESLFRLQDTDYCWRIQLAGTKLHFVPEAVIQYRFRHTVAGLYRQARLWGEYNVLLYKKYRTFGMNQPSKKTMIKAWLKLLLSFPKIFLGKGKRANWIWKLGWRVGRLNGCIKHQVLAL